jgi:hypothetical protein
MVSTDTVWQAARLYDCGANRNRIMTAATFVRTSAAQLLATAVIPAREFTVFCKGESITFQSTFMDDCAWDLMKYLPSSFAQSLYNADKLSEKQLAWVHKLAMDYKEREESAALADTGEAKFASLFEAFKAARSKGAKRLTLRFAGINVKPSKDLAALWVTSQDETEEGRYGLQPKYLGKVTPTGMDSRLPDEVKSVLTEAATDPLTAAIRYGKVSGECSCCGRELTDPQSIARGIGPICATKFGW